MPSSATMKLRKAIHPLLLKIFAANEKKTGMGFQLEPGSRPLPRKTGIIFATNHVNAHDIPTVAYAVKEHFYIFAAEEGCRRSADRLAFNLNGVIWCNRGAQPEHKASRAEAKEQAIEHLQQCGNLLLSPEGTWNRSYTPPLLPFHWGIYDIAKESGALIVPVVFFYEEHIAHVHVGEPFDWEGYSDRKTAVEALRGTMAGTLQAMRNKYWSNLIEDERRELYERLSAKWWSEYPLDEELERLAVLKGV